MRELVELGKHYICEMSDCNRDVLVNNHHMEDLFLKAALSSNLTVVSKGSFEFTPHGFTCYLLLAESHASLHVWPEYRYCAVDIFTCDLEMDVSPFFQRLERCFGSGSMSTTMIARGCLWGNNE